MIQNCYGSVFRLRICRGENLRYLIKAHVPDVRAKVFVFTAQKTMYGGKNIAPGDTVFVFASENVGG